MILFAWAVPAWFSHSPVDHTWVTTYDNQAHPYGSINEVVAAGQDYWYCWGDFHPKGHTPVNASGALGAGEGDLATARKLVQANADCDGAPGARGTIFVYGHDGVCHQLANQVLYATRATRPKPLRVGKARGYFASVFLYGTYGLQHRAWAAKVQQVFPQHVAAEYRTGGMLRMPDLPDDFEEHVRTVLAGDDASIGKVLELRASTQMFLSQAMPGHVPLNADVLNLRNQHLLDQVAREIGAEKFTKIFGFPPDQKINLVDPRLAETPE